MFGSPLTMAQEVTKLVMRLTLVIAGILFLYLGAEQLAYVVESWPYQPGLFTPWCIAIVAVFVTAFAVLHRTSMKSFPRVSAALASSIVFVGLSFFGALWVACSNGNCI
jgi:hypothetical protein